MGRWGTVREIADAAVYLFSDAAGFVTGQTLVGRVFFFFFLFPPFFPLILGLCDCLYADD